MPTMCDYFKLNAIASRLYMVLTMVSYLRCTPNKTYWEPLY